MTNPPKDLLPVWAKYAAVSYLFDRTELSLSDKKGQLDVLDELHDQLVQATDAVEELANRIRKSMQDLQQSGPGEH